jgi:hypothetical protein
MALPLDGEPKTGPVLYLACPLTSVDPTTRQLVDSWCTHITNTVSETAADSERPWRVAVHAPVVWSNPARGDTRAPEAIYTLNSRQVRACAGMIVLSIAGGSTGIGQELAWAVAMRVPVLYLHHKDEAVSKQVLGTPGDLTVVAFSDATDLVEAVRTYLRAQRPVIEDQARRSIGEALKFAALRISLAEAWDNSGERGQARVEAEGRVHRARIVELLEDDNALGMASVSELTALAGALDVSLASLVQADRLPELGERAREALALVCDEYEWSGSKALELEFAARFELARGGIRRLTFQSPDDWIRFDQRRAGHA